MLPSASFKKKTCVCVDSRSCWVLWCRAGKTFWLNREIQTQWGVNHETIGCYETWWKMTALWSFYFPSESDLLGIFYSQVRAINRHATQSRMSSRWLLSLPIVFLLLLDWQLRVLGINHLLRTNWNVATLILYPFGNKYRHQPRTFKIIKVYLLFLIINSTAQ